MEKKTLGKVRVQLLSARSLRISFCAPSSKDAESWVHASRLANPSSMDVERMVVKIEDFLERKRVSIKDRQGAAAIDYKDLDIGLVKEVGWYLPPDKELDRLYSGLDLQDVVNLSPAEFRNNIRMEAVSPTSSTYLGAYVGEEDGALCAKLQDVSRLLDCPFDGLCVHRLPRLPVTSNFRLGVITGPSGSGKSTLAREAFGAGYEPLWDPTIPVLGHFKSLSHAEEFLSAASLSLQIAMRPFATLSCGEQARAALARNLEHAASMVERAQSGLVAASDAVSTQSYQENLQQGQAIILEEFTSLVDRYTAKRMATGVMNLINCRKLSNIVVVSCHDDFVGVGHLEPDWLFECHNQRFLRFTGPSKSSLEDALSDGNSRLPCLSKPRDLLDSVRAESVGLRSKIETGAADLTAQVDQAIQTGIDSKARLVGKLQNASQTLGATTQHGESNVTNCLGIQSGLDEAALPKRRHSPKESEDIDNTWHDIEQNPSQHMNNLLKPPVVELEVRRALQREWMHFREHHYKDHSLQGSSIAFVGLFDSHAVAFTAVVPCQHFVRQAMLACRPGGSLEGQNQGFPLSWATEGEAAGRKLFREHRTVVLPDAQGMGFGPLLCDAVATIFHRIGHDFTSQTVHPHYGSYRNRSSFWRALPTNQQARAEINGNRKFSHVFVGAACSDDGSEDPQCVEKLNARIVFARPAGER